MTGSSRTTPAPPSTSQVKATARDFGAQLVGVASIEALADEPHPPGAILNGARSIVVLARRFGFGAARLRDATSRSAHYAMELGLTELEDISLRLMFHLEDLGFPSLMLPAASSRSKQEDMAREGPLSLTHAAVAAGLGTVGLGGQLLTPEYGPRVMLSAVLTLAPLDADEPLLDGLCLGEQCGRCLLSCPGDAIGRWATDVEACRPHSAPYGYPTFRRHVTDIVLERDPEKKWELATSKDSLMLWQSMLRGVGVETGCTRCQDVCPVGADYEQRLADALDEIPERTAAKEDRLVAHRRSAVAGDLGAQFDPRWCGRPDGGHAAGTGE